MSDPLNWIFTNYGNNRIAQAIADNSVEISLYKIKIGNGNGSYYIPDPTQTNLLNIIDSFDIILTDLSEEDNTVTFSCNIPVTSSGYVFREVGIFETIDNVDYLFAIGTCEPFNKPSVDNNYIMDIEYKIAFKSVNLSSVYDQIKVNLETRQVIDEELEKTQLDFLYIEDNLAEQISNNATILGAERPAVIQKRIDQNLKSLSRYFVYDTILNIKNLVVDEDNIKCLSVFNYSVYPSNLASIVDFSPLQNNINLNNSSVNYGKYSESFASFFKFNSENYYYINKDMNFNLQKNNIDYYFTYIQLLKHNESNLKETIFAKVNEYTGNASFKIEKGSDNSLAITLYTDLNNYVEFKTSPDVLPVGESYVLTIKYNGIISDPVIDIFVNDNPIMVVKADIGTYDGMANIEEVVGCFTINDINEYANFFNSDSSFLVIISQNLPPQIIKSISYNLLALVGKDVCLLY